MAPASSRLFSWRKTTETLSIALMVIATASMAAGDEQGTLVQHRSTESIMNNNAGLRGISEGEMSAQENEATEENERSLAAKKKATKKSSSPKPAASVVPAAEPCEAVAVYARSNFACTRTSSDKIRCWGENSYQKLGYTGVASVPAAAFWGNVYFGTSEATVTDMGLGGQHNCVVMSTGSARCWGWAAYGQLGIASTTNRGSPTESGDVSIGNMMLAREINGQSHATCVVTTTGQAKCWGYNPYGNLGLGHTSNIGDDDLPSGQNPISLGGVVTRMASGDYFSCAILDNGQCRCWGYNQGTGRLGLGSNYYSGYLGDNEAPSSVPAINFGEGVIAVAINLGGGFACITTDSAKVFCWGDNNHGQLGYGNANIVGDNEHPLAAGPVSLYPDVASEANKVVQLAPGANHMCALFTAGEVKCWGQPLYGQLGYGNVNYIGDNEVPSTVGFVSVGGAATYIAAGDLNTYAILEDGSIKSWGANASGELGIGNYYASGTYIGDNEVPSAVVWPVARVFFCDVKSCSM